MHKHGIQWLIVLSLFSGSAALAADSVKARQHNCTVLQDRARDEGSVSFKLLLGTLTVHHRVQGCDLTTHQIITPSWRTADERACVVGSYCTILNHGHIE